MSQRSLLVVTAAPDDRPSTSTLVAVVGELRRRGDLRTELWFLRHGSGSSAVADRVVDDLRTTGPAAAIDRFGLSPAANLVRGRLPEGDFSDNVYQAKVDIFLSPDLGLMNYVQFDDISNTLGWNARLRWQLSPGNEVYLVYTKNWERVWDPQSRFMPLQDRGVVKISLSIRP